MKRRGGSAIGPIARGPNGSLDDMGFIISALSGDDKYQYLTEYLF